MSTHVLLWQDVAQFIHLLCLKFALLTTIQGSEASEGQDDVCLQCEAGLR